MTIGFGKGVMVFDRMPNHMRIYQYSDWCKGNSEGVERRK